MNATDRRLAAAVLAAACLGACVASRPAPEPWCATGLVAGRPMGRCSPGQLVHCPRGTHSSSVDDCALDEGKPAKTCPIAVDVKASSDEARHVAKSLVESGAEYDAAGDMKGACARYERAAEVLPVSPVLSRSAACAAKRGEVVYAVSCYRRIVAFPLSPDATAPFTRANADAVGALPALVARVASIAVVVDPDDAPEASLDGVPVSVSELARGVEVDPGAHRIVVVARHGGVVGAIDVSLREGERKSLALTLEALPCEGVVEPTGAH